MKSVFMVLNNAYAFFGTTLYVGVLWSLHFFWFPTWTSLKADNYYDQFIPQTSAATEFFTIVVPLMFLAHAVMVWKEWKGGYRFTSLGALLMLAGATYVGTLHIIPVNKILKGRVTDQAQVTELLKKWMELNDIRMLLMTLSWCLLMFYFGSKAYRYDNGKGARA
jgi:hypothetical protein